MFLFFSYLIFSSSGWLTQIHLFLSFFLSFLSFFFFPPILFQFELVATYYFLALFRVRDYGKIAEQIERYKTLVNPKGDSEEGIQEPALPFVFLWIYAEYPIHRGKVKVGLDRLYRLLQNSRLLKGYYDGKLQFDVGSSEMVPVSDMEISSRETLSNISLQGAWDRRIKMLLCVIACHHCAQKQYATALKLMSGLAQAKDDPHYLCLLSYILLQLGDVRSARKIAETLRDYCQKQNSDNEAAALLANLEGLLLFASDDFQEAIGKFEKASSLSPDNPVPCNNLAVGHMYAKDLHVGIKVLENKLAQNHTFILQKPMVLNLCSMYELASTRCNESKHTLHSWILKHAPDDFDSRSTRLS